MSIEAAPERRARGLAGILERHGRAVDYPKGRMIYATGAQDSSMMLITKGRVEISRSSVDGRRSILTHLGPGDMLGELAALDGGARSADAVAATAVQGRVLEGALVLQRLREEPDAALDVIGMLCQRLRQTSGMYTAHMLADGQARLARLLLHLSEKWGEALPGGKLRLAERFSQSDLGDLVGLSRESVNRQFRDWEQAGVIAREGMGIVLCDPGALARAAEMAE
ncbi:Crp/Fnr family transcriptional regulator [uncultured Roseovarius sp.]|uniref:Crp/Fnr family transcriptional regulator n=1 Tax=uncultured Roseovarius sp. TaxID=293344 RepID=UPI000C361A3A|nr:Crp/Fnr family transcriptional regulator [Roseovarius sp.]MBD12744.1 Crp/Fnr family transcriptional regulator [Roseovarius sp.]|tara:strand:+ start:785 stop:1459 length:675 start_codon:yes stop_codon:yes gene_type:complete